MVGYSPDTIEYGDNNIIVSYDRYDKKIKELAKKILEEKGLLYNSLNLNNIATKVFLYD